jgi:hypothetical protein
MRLLALAKHHAIGGPAFGGLTKISSEILAAG